MNLSIHTAPVSLALLLTCYTSVTLAIIRYPTTTWGGKIADGIVGLGGGALGGLAGLSGPLPTIWCGLRGWDGDAQRAVYQPYNLIILSIDLCTYIADGTMTGEIWRSIALCTPATMIGTFLGTRTCGRVNDQQFRVIVLWLLLGSGVALAVLNII